MYSFIQFLFNSLVSEDNLKRSLNIIQTNVKQLETDVKNARADQSDPSDRFGELMAEFLVNAREQYEVLASMYSKLEATFREVSKYYAFDPKKYTCEELLNDLKHFRDAFIVRISQKFNGSWQKDK